MSRQPGRTKNFESFEHFASLAPALLWRSDSFGNGSWFSQDWLNFRGVSEEHEMIEGWHSAFSPEELTKFLAAFRSAYHSNTSYEIICKVRRHDNSERLILMRGVPLLANKDFIGFVNSAYDITEARNQYDKVAHNEVRLRKLLDEALVGFAEMDVQEVLRYSNPAFYKMLGYNRIDILGKSLSSLTLPEDIEGLKLQIRNMLASKAKSIEYQVRFFHKKGTIIHCLLKISPIRNASGVIQGFNAQAIDISELNILEQDLKQANSRLQMALRTGRIGIWDWDLQQNILIWDDSQYHLFGVDKSRNEIKDLASWINLIYGRDQAQLERQIENILEGEESRIYKYRIRKKSPGINGDNSNEEANSARDMRDSKNSENQFSYICVTGQLEKDERGNPLRVAGLCWDVSEIQYREKELNLQSAQSTLSSRMEAFSEFSKVIASELSSPLKKLQEFSELAQKGVTSVYSEGAETFAGRTLDSLKALDRETVKISRIIHDAEKLAMLPSGDKLVEYPLKRLIQDSIDLIASRLEQHHIEFKEIFLADLQEEKVNCVPRQMTHILLSILTDAIRQVSNLETRWIHLEIQKHDNFIQIKIVNSDIILPAKQEGLGLQIINTLLSHLGSSIFFDPTAEHTTCILEVPVAVGTQSELKQSA